MIARIIGFTWLIISLPATALAYTTPAGIGYVFVGEYQRAMANPDTKPSMIVYMRGMLDGFAMANGEILARRQALLFCTPTNYIVTGTQELSILDHYLHDVSFGPNLPVSAAVLRALADTFPCN